MLDLDNVLLSNVIEARIMANSAVIELRSRGITEHDVWHAADALLLEGARPTIERVRQKIGRGSPNTVSPHLDAWFSKLGARIKDPLAFSAPPAIPDPVQQAATHFWEAALAETRRDFDERLRAGLADAVANVEAEKERANIAEGAAFEASSKVAHLQAELAQRDAALEEQTRSRVGVEALLARSQASVDDLRRRLDTALEETTEIRKSSERAISEAIDRFTAAERRAALEIDHERTARSRAEGLLSSVERRLEAAQKDAFTQHKNHTEAAAKMEASRVHLRDEVARAKEREAVLKASTEELSADLERARRDAKVARAESELAQRVVSSLRPLSVQRRNVAKKRVVAKRTA